MAARVSLIALTGVALLLGPIDASSVMAAVIVVDSSDPDGEETPWALEVNHLYRIEVTGLVEVWYPNEFFVDAEWLNDPDTEDDFVENRLHPDFSDNLDLLINEQYVDWWGTQDGGSTFQLHTFSDDVNGHVYRAATANGADYWRDSDGNPLWLGTGEALTFRLQDGGAYYDNVGSFTVTVTDVGQVPEPGTFLTWGGLLGMGLVGGYWRRRKTAA